MIGFLELLYLRSPLPNRTGGESAVIKHIILNT